MNALQVSNIDDPWTDEQGSKQGPVRSYSLDMPECLMLLNTIDTSSMHSISSLLDTTTHLTSGAQPGETTRRNADNGSLERETERDRERVCVCVDTVGCHPSYTTKRERERERVHRRRSDDDGHDVLMSTRHTRHTRHARPMERRRREKVSMQHLLASRL